MGRMTVTRLIGGRYRLDERIGHGSMGTVFRAYDEVLRRVVAVKEVHFPAGLPAAEVAQLSDRTLREARAIAALSHPHVITVFDMVTTQTGPAIVMELVEAQSLAEILARSGPLDPVQAARIGAAVASGLAAAHASGITHRDVKPANVLVADDGRIKLTDFGIARAANEMRLTATGVLLGSPSYIAPEVAAGRAATPSADAWGLGALLYALVEGKPPYDAGKPVDTIGAVVADPVPAHPHSGPLAPVIDALLSKDPGRRMTVGEAERSLERIAHDADSARARATTGPSAGRSAGPSENQPGSQTADRHGLGGPAKLDTGESFGAHRNSAAFLPPPPWESDDAAALAPLPVGRAPERNSPNWWVLAAAFLAAAALGAMLVISAAALAR